MTIRLFVERGLALQAVISRPNLRIISPQFRQARVSISKPSYTAVPSYQLIQTSTDYRDLVTLTSYLRPFIRDVVLDPDSKNLYLRDPASNFAALSDTQAIALETLRADSFGFSDSDAKGFGKVLSDNTWIIEEISILLEILRQFDDSVSFSDSQTISYGSNQADTVVVSESSSFDFAKELEDQSTVFDAQAIAVSRPESDSYTVSDLFSKQVAFARGFDEQISFSDTNTLSFGKVNTDTLFLSEAAAVGFDKDATDGITVAESLSRVVTFTRTFADAFTLDDQAEVDSFTKETGLNKGNVFGLQETHSYALSKGFADSAALTEQAVAAVAKTEADSVSVSEVISIANRSGVSSVFNAGPFNLAPLNN